MESAVLKVIPGQVLGVFTPSDSASFGKILTFWKFCCSCALICSNRKVGKRKLSVSQLSLSS